MTGVVEKKGEGERRLQRRVGEEDEEKERRREFGDEGELFSDPTLIKGSRSRSGSGSEKRNYYFIHRFYFLKNIIFMKMPS